MTAAASVVNLADYRPRNSNAEMTMSEAVDLLEVEEGAEAYSVSYGDRVEVLIHKDDFQVEREISERRSYFLLQGIRTIQEKDAELAAEATDVLLNAEIALGTLDACTLWREDNCFIMRTTSNRGDGSLSIDVKIAGVL